MTKDVLRFMRGLAVLAAMVGGLPAARAAHPILSTVDLYPHGSMICHDLEYSKGFVYASSQSVSGSGATIYSIDATDPHQLRYVTRSGFGSKAYGLKIVDDTLFAASWGAGLRVFLQGAGAMEYLWAYYPDKEPAHWDVDVYRQRAYATAADEGDIRVKGIRILDVSSLSPSNPDGILISRVVTNDRNIRAIVVRGSYIFYTNGLSFEVANISDELQPYVLAVRPLQNAYCIEGLCVRGDYAYVCASNPGGAPGFAVYDISDPTNPIQTKVLYDVGGKNTYLLGDYAFVATSGNGLATMDISNPADPRVVDYTQMDVASDSVSVLEQSVTGNGRNVYVGTIERSASGEDGGRVYALQAFDYDPDDEGPGSWSGISTGEADWDTQYTADALPSLARPTWKLLEGSELCASVSGGVLRVNDASTAPGAKVRWCRNWDVTDTRGGTVLVRARCDSYDPGSGGMGGMGNLLIENGKYQEEFAFLSDRIRANRANLEAPIDGGSWHTYRITLQTGQFKVYVDEADSPTLQGNLWATTARARVIVGTFSSPARQDIFFDEINCCSTAATLPSPPLAALAPTVRIQVAETAGKGSLSGIVPTSAAVRWSTDGGATWTSSGDQWECAYEGNELPSSSSPQWNVMEGSESLATLNSGTLCVTDNSTASGSKIKWSRAWRADPSRGTTVLARIRCTATGGDLTYLDNMVIADGVRSERFRILPDRVQAVDSGLVHSLNATEWHTYRVTTLGSSFSLYVDEQPTPVMSGAMTSTTSDNRLWFGSGASSGTQTIWFDYVRYNGRQVLPPGEGDGGGQVTVSCTGPIGNNRATINAYSVPFNGFSALRNKLQFTLKDVAGNVGFSPIYTVRIGQLNASDQDDDHDVDQEDFGALQMCMSESDGAVRMGCERADLDLDGDVDLTDVQLFASCLSGPGVRADEDCAD